MLWLWFTPAAVAPILPLAWELLYTAGTDLKKKGGGIKGCSSGYQQSLAFQKNSTNSSFLFIVSPSSAVPLTCGSV